jgi:hypothetical protein
MHPDRRTFTLRRALASMVASAAVAISAPTATAQDPVLRARALTDTASVKMYNPAGSVRIVGWDRDSIVVRGHVARGEHFYFSGDAGGVKLGIRDRADDRAPAACNLVIYLPRRSRISVKTVSAGIAGTDVSGWFYSVSGSIHLSGSATSIDAQTMSGDLDLDVAVPWVRAQTGDGRLLLHGAPQDADASTIAGTLDVASAAIVRGRFFSVTGDIRYTGAPPSGGLLEFSNHSGQVDLLLPRAVVGFFDLSTITGQIENGLTQLRPASDVAGRGQTLKLNLGRDGGRVTVRTFKGTIHLRSP